MSTPRIGDRLQALTGTHVRFAGRALPAYQLCGYVGFALAVPLSFTLVGVQRLSYAAMAMVVTAAVLAVIGQAIVTTLVHGEEDLVYYRHVLAVTVVADARPEQADLSTRRSWESASSGRAGARLLHGGVLPRTTARAWRRV